MPRAQLFPAIALLSIYHFSAVRAHEPATSIEISIPSPVASLSGTLLFPVAAGKVPCVVILGGTLSQDRDGRMLGRAAPPRAALQRLAEALASRGYASLRFDRVGYGKSRPSPEWKGTYANEAQAAASAIQLTRGRSEVSRVIVAAESAGAYMACIAAKDGVLADGYIFLGGLCGQSEEMYEFNFGRLVAYAESQPARLEWATRELRHDLALGRHFREIFAAARAGQAQIEIVDGDYRTRMDLARRIEEIAMPPDAMFRYIRDPVLALQGERDRNVPPGHAARIAQVVKEAGVADATSITIPDADHSFQVVPADEDEQVRLRYTLESFRLPYSSRLDGEMIAWLSRRFPSVAGDGGSGEVVDASASVRAAGSSEPRWDPVTGSTPERLQLAPGVEIIDDITDKSKTAGVGTLEGRIGPLLLAEGCQAHFIDMPRGLFVAEHAHSTESIIFTVRGQWVLVSQGRRHLMKPGGLFRFGAKISTGYEVPFNEDALLLVFKGDRTTRTEQEFIDYLKGMAARLEKEHMDGSPFLLGELPKDHPARVFAREVNPKFEEAPAR